MSALGLGLIAAFCWGFHDVCVRYISQRTPLMAALLMVLLVGLAFHLLLMVSLAGFAAMPPTAFWYSLWSGVFFLTASLGLYAAFQRGPVRLVAPIIASYPLLSVLWAVSSGAQVSVVEWLAVAAIILGVSIVAALADDGSGDVLPKGRTIFYAAVSSVGFAGTFALGQSAAELSGEMPTTLVTRLTAVGLLLVIILARRLPLWPGRAALPILALMGVADGIALNSVLSAGGLPNAQHAAVASSTFGLLTIVMAWAFLREKMTASQWFGCAVTFAGIGYLAL